MGKLHLILLAIFLALTDVAFSQVSGKILMDSMSLPGATIKFKQSTNFAMTDFDGNFSLPVESKIENYNLLISYVDLIIEIENFELSDGKMDIGDFEIPYFKSISIVEFEQLSESEKENCHPIYCWTQLLGYYYTNKLENEHLTLNCKEKITKFEFNSTTKTIVVDWKSIKDCK